MAEDRTPLLAVLIDGDNSSHNDALAIFEEIATLGEASVRRVYGDFSSSQMKGWSDKQAALGLVGALGGRRLRDRYASTTNTQLARALIRVADQADAQVVVAEAADLR